MELQRRYGAGRLVRDVRRGGARRSTGRCGCSASIAPPRRQSPQLSPAVQRGARRLCRRGQRLSRDAPRRAAARIPAAALHARAVAPGRQLVWGKLMARSSPAITAASCCARGWRSTLSADGPRLPLSRLSEGRADDARRRWRRSTAQLPLDALYAGAAADGRAASTPRTTGWSTARTAPAASRCSPTIRISALPRRASGISRGSRRPEHEIAGATAPGAPLVVIGHNDRIAWGFTTTDRRCRGSLHREARSRRSRRAT